MAVTIKLDLPTSSLESAEKKSSDFRVSTPGGKPYSSIHSAAAGITN
jgi:hypothetical protein